MSNDDLCYLLLALVGLPNGVLAMSFAMPGLVETSSNLASVKFNHEEREVVITTSQRSSVESAKLYLCADHRVGILPIGLRCRAL